MISFVRDFQILRTVGIPLVGRLIFQVFDLMRKQEETRLAEVATEKAQYLAIQAQGEVVSFLSIVFFILLVTLQRIFWSYSLSCKQTDAVSFFY